MQMLGESSHQPSASPSLPAPPLPPLPPSEEQDASQPPSAQLPIMSTSTSTDHLLSTDNATITSTSSDTSQLSTVGISTPHTVVPDAIVASTSAPEAVPVPPAIEEGAETPPITPPTSKVQMEESMMEGAKEEVGTEILEDEEGEEIMECDMEIDDESPEASGEETTPTPMPSTDSISVATSIPVPNLTTSSALPDEGQKVNQDLPPSSQEGSKGGVGGEDDEPLPPGVEKEKEPEEPLPPGMEDSSSVLSTTKDADKTTVSPGDEKNSEPLLSRDSGKLYNMEVVQYSLTTLLGKELILKPKCDTVVSILC